MAAGERTTGLAPVVVAIDGSAGSLSALRWAVEEAVLRGVAVEVVHVWSTPHAGGTPGLPFYSLEPEELQGAARAVLAAAAAEADAAAGGTVEVRPVLREGLPAAELLAAGEGAAMLVVGSRGLGGFRGLLLGSVSQQVLQHAPCPVVVVRPPAAVR